MLPGITLLAACLGPTPQSFLPQRPTGAGSVVVTEVAPVGTAPDGVGEDVELPAVADVAGLTELLTAGVALVPLDAALEHPATIAAAARQSAGPLRVRSMLITS